MHVADATVLHDPPRERADRLPVGPHGRRLFDLKPPPATVLDIAAGNCALTARLIDDGYDVTGSDLDPSPFELDIPCTQMNLDIPCTQVNLDFPFADKLGGPYDAIVAVDVIEHLESPAAFLRGCAELLAQDGVLIVSFKSRLLYNTWVLRLIERRWGAERWRRETVHSPTFVSRAVSRRR